MAVVLTQTQQTGLNAAILAHLAAEEGGRFERMVAAFREEVQVGGGGGGEDALIVSGGVLEEAWSMCFNECFLPDDPKWENSFGAYFEEWESRFDQYNVEEAGLAAALMAYLAEDGRFTRTLAALKKAIHASGFVIDDAENAMAMSGKW